MHELSKLDLTGLNNSIAKNNRRIEMRLTELALQFILFRMAFQG